MHKVFSAEIDQLYEMLQFVRSESIEAGFEPTNTYKIEMAAEEALVNIINYGYPNTHGEIEILCRSNLNESLTIVIKDSGVSYNPLKTPLTYNPKAPVQEHPVGGYGIFFITKLMDSVDYKREDNSNILTLYKKISRAS